MPATWTLKPPDDQASRDRFSAILAMTFHMSADEVQRYVQRIGESNLRIVTRGKRIVGGLALIPTGQWFGGRVVSSTGITSVCIQPHQRSRGAGRHLLKETLHELHDSGAALSVLYPVTQAGYRRMGYEQAGALWSLRLPLAHIGVKERELDVHEITPDDHAALDELHQRRAALHNGHLQRTEFFWKEIRKPDIGETHGYAIKHDGRIEAYIYYVHQKSEEAFYTLHATDLCVGTAEAGRGLLSFLADHRSMADQVRWRGSPSDPFLLLTREQTYRASLKSHWMLRIVDVHKALTERGYPRSVEAELHLDVRDETLPANNGRFVLRVCDGSAEVEQGGNGAIKLDIRGLAALYSSHQWPGHLAQRGYVEAEDESLAQLAAVFAGPAPWMADMF